jgi:L-ascorbate metabolism protein UlaG (beta-lactamase superfamily)
MIHKIKLIMIYLVSIILVLALGVYLFMQQAQFGKLPTGKRLERIQKSSHYQNGAFHNQSFTPDLAEGITYWDLIKAYFPKVVDKEPNQAIPFVKTDLKSLPNDSTSIVWFGHSSYLLHTAGKNILVDPVFSGNASPVSFFGKNYEGSNQYSVDDLPNIDILIITHDHYDHLDYPTIKKLLPKVHKVVTSLGVGEHLEYWGYAANQITELEWWEQTTLLDSISITATPARHFSGRGFKRNQAFWSSFVLKTASEQIYIGGDSGYDSHFKEIGAKFGSFDFVLLECGQYNSFWKYIHMMPEEVALAAQELNAKVLMPVHWSKFSLALHPWYEPIDRVTAAAQKLGIIYTTPQIGQKVVLNQPLPNSRWWDTLKSK